MINLLRKYIIKYFNTISFDIFDTLLIRNVNDPRDIFKIVGNKYFQSDVDAFVRNRIEAEKQARKFEQEGEVSLSQIYNVLKEKYPNIYLSDVQIYEENVEIELISIRKNVADLYYDAIRNHKKVYLITDMYLSENIIKKMLIKCGINEYDRLYISNIYKMTKKTGSLFDKFINDNKIICKKHLHIGDSFKSDFIEARKKKMKSLLVYRKNFIGRLFNSILGRYE